MARTITRAQLRTLRNDLADLHCMEQKWKWQKEWIWSTLALIDNGTDRVKFDYWIVYSMKAGGTAEPLLRELGITVSDEEVDNA